MSDFKIEDVTICLHCGSRPDIVERQTQELKRLGDYYNITWNNRIDRYPHAYPSYSELINEAVSTSKDEFIISKVGTTNTGAATGHISCVRHPILEPS